MSKHSAVSPAGDSGRADAGQREAGADADEDEDGDGNGAPAAATALSRLLARLPGERRQWRVAGMVAGGILLGGLASGGVAWKMIGSRNAEVEARTAKLDLQSSRIAAQEAHIEVLTRAVKERPLPEEGANPDRSPQTSAPSDAAPSDAAPSDAAPAPVPALTLVPAAVPGSAVAETPPAVKAAEPPPPVAKATAAPVQRAQAAPVPSAQPGASSGPPPSAAGSGTCDVPGGTEGMAQMRKCIEWFAGRSKSPAKPAH